MCTFAEYAKRIGASITDADVKKSYAQRRRLALRPDKRVFPGINSEARVRGEMTRGAMMFARERARRDAEHERLLMAQIPGADNFAAEYCERYEKLNNLRHVPAAFCAPCDLGDDE